MNVFIITNTSITETGIQIAIQQRVLWSRKKCSIKPGESSWPRMVACSKQVLAELERRNKPFRSTGGPQYPTIGETHELVQVDQQCINFVLEQQFSFKRRR